MADEIVLIEARLDATKAEAQLRALAANKTADVDVAVDKSTAKRAEATVDTITRDRRTEIELDVDGKGKAETQLDFIARDRRVELKLDVDGLKAGGEALGGLLTRLPGLGNLGAGLGGLGDEVGNLATQFSALGAAGPAGLAVLATVGVLAVSAGAAAASLKAFTGQAGKVRQLVATSGLGAEDASRQIEAFDDLGISAEQVAKIYQRIQISTAKGKLGDFGIEAGSDSLETFNNIADAIARTPDPAKRTQIAVALLGRDAAKLVPVLAKGSEAFAELAASTDKNLILSDKDLVAAKQVGLAFDGIQDTIRGVFTGIGADLAPLIIGLGDSLNSIAPVLRVIGTQVLEKLVKPFAAFVGVTDIVISFFQNLGGIAKASLGVVRNEIKGAIEAVFDAIPGGGTIAEALFGGDWRESFKPEDVDLTPIVDQGTKIRNVFAALNGEELPGATNGAAQLALEMEAAEAAAAAVAEETERITTAIQAALDTVRAASDAKFGLAQANIDLANLAGGAVGDNEAAVPANFSDAIAQAQAAASAVDAAVTNIDALVQQQVDSGAIQIQNKAGAVLAFVQGLRDQQIALGTNPEAIAQLDAYIAKLAEVKSATANVGQVSFDGGGSADTLERRSAATPTVVPVTADTTAADTAIAAIPAKAAATPASIPVEADTAAASTEITLAARNRTSTITFKAAGLQTILDKLTRIKDKTIKITVNYQATGAIPRYRGGPVAKGSLYEVAERGPELAEFSNGASILFKERQLFVAPSAGRVLNAADTRRTINTVSSQVTSVAHGSPSITVMSPHPLLAGKDVHRTLVGLAKKPKAKR